MRPHEHALTELLLKIEKEIPSENTLTLVGVGDTAMALLDLKAQTVHVDFTGEDQDMAEFSRICTNMRTAGFRIHTWKNGFVFGQQLPQDYLKASLPINAGLSRIDLRALHPLDLVVTRIERLSETDMRDIKVCIRQFKLGKNQISKRANALQRVGDESRFERNLDSVLGLFEQSP